MVSRGSGTSSEEAFCQSTGSLRQRKDFHAAVHFEDMKKKQEHGKGDREASPSKASNGLIVYIALGKLSHKLAFIFGLIIGGFFARVDVVSPALQASSDLVLGYEYDWAEGCVVMRSKYQKKKIDWCREPVDCYMCQDVISIDIVAAEDMTPELFLEEYAYTGRPVLIKNVTANWEAMEAFSFDFFRNLYLELDSPVLDNKEKDCQFFAWDFAEFESMYEVFQMTEYRASLADGYNPWYIGWANCDRKAMYLLQSYYERPSFLPKNSNSGRKDWFFMGTPGFGAPFHIDNVEYPSWQAQIRGVKSWSLRAPPECSWTCSMAPMNVTLEPGDVIVVNTNWWEHATEVVEDLSITVTNEYT